MKKISLFLFVIGFLFFILSGHSPDKESKDPSTLTKLGQTVPTFSVVTIDGKKIDIQKMRGKVLLINFFADWCVPCKKEMPFLEKDIWQKYKDRDFYILSLGRENSADVVKKFKKEMEVTFPMAPDPKREIYSKFATQFIPRNYVIDKKGIIVYQAKGFEKEEFNHMIAIIEKTLKN